MLDFVGKRYWYFLLSALIIVPGLISLAIPPGLRPGIDFSSGSTMSIRFEASVEQSTLRDAMAAIGHGEAIIQRTGDNTFLIRTRTLEEEQKDAEGKVIKPGEKQQLEEILRERFGALEVLSFDSVSPLVAGETVRNAALAVLGATVGILLYIWWAFRQVPKPLRYGVCAVIALLHDVAVVVGVYSILGKLLHYEVDAMFITACLTVVGFSVHDTIVVFDRIRENLKKGIGSFEFTVNQSILQTVGRSLMTSLTALFALLAVYLFGGVTIRHFVLVLIIGITSGTYSSIFNASQLLVAWEAGDFARLRHRLAFR